MKNAAEIARAIIAHAEANGSINWAYAIRTDYASKKIGSTCRRSCDWNHDTDRPSSKKLSGTCGTKIDAEIDRWTEYEDVVKAVEAAMNDHADNRYHGERTYIIAGNADYAVGGEDPDEIILSADTRRTYQAEAIKGAKVVCIVK